MPDFINPTFNFTALQSTFDTEIERICLIRKKPKQVDGSRATPIFKAVAKSIYGACMTALGDRVGDPAQHKALHRTLPAGTGTGKSSAAFCFISALIKTCPDTSVLLVVPDVRQAEEAYLELSQLIDEEDIGIWTGGHDAKSTLIQIADNHQGFQPNAPRMKKADLKDRRVALISHQWYIEHGGRHPCMLYANDDRTLHIIDERLAETKLRSLELVSIREAKDVVGLEVDAQNALVRLEQVAMSALATIEGPLYVPMDSDEGPLAWFSTSAAKHLEANSVSPLSEVVSFGRSMVAGHAFLARFPSKPGEQGGGVFISYALDIPRIPGSVLLDASSDIDGVTPFSSWRSMLPAPAVSFKNLSIHHRPFPIVDPNGRKKSIKDITESGTLSEAYVAEMRRIIVEETQPGEHVLVVTHKALLAQNRLPEKRSFDDPDVLEGDRKVAYLTYGRGIGSNLHSKATTVLLFGMFWRPIRVTLGKVLALKKAKARGMPINSMANSNSRDKLMTTIANGDLLRWAKQLSMRGAARNFDADGVCGEMKLVVLGEDDLWLKSWNKLFPGAAFTQSKDTRAKAVDAGGSTAVASFITANAGREYAAREMCEALGILPNHLALYLRSEVAQVALASTSTVYIQGKGRAPSRFQLAQPLAVAAE
jgi:hypothetical protein